MQKSTARFIEKFIDAVTSNGNHDVYDPKLNTSDPYRIVPYVIYFYYVTFLENGKPSVQHYLQVEEDPIPYDEMEGRIKDLAWKVRSSDKTLHLIGEDFQDIKWYHKSYIAIFMDSPYWKILSRSNGDSAIVFTVSKDGMPNHSFFDAKDLAVDMSHDGIIETRSAVYFINHMKKSDFGDDLGYNQLGKQVPEKEKFSFDVYFDVSDGPSGPSTLFIIDPDGTNMGPPQSPP